MPFAPNTSHLQTRSDVLRSRTFLPPVKTEYARHPSESLDPCSQSPGKYELTPRLDICTHVCTTRLRNIVPAYLSALTSISAPSNHLSFDSPVLQCEHRVAPTTSCTSKDPDRAGSNDNVYLRG